MISGGNSHANLLFFSVFLSLANRIATGIVSGSQSKQCTSSGAGQNRILGADL
jgi:hypothetical protein